MLLEERKLYLWVNLMDLSTLGTIGPFGSPLNLMIRKELGDELLPGCYYHPQRLDDNFVVVETKPDRARALVDCLEMIGKRKINRKVRTRITVRLPGKPWQWKG